ncbi:MAG: response regulator [Propionivibrio sp.]|nr:response regulator [Propionivibrio sp.]MBK7355887.1 response regulator [Propionivibrio sp.]MBK8400452.1 response regulator [Propionivibrio sp.]MBL0206810.1 response regulator [Propionivibrio sp.]
MYESLLYIAIALFVAILLLRAFMFRRSTKTEAARQEAERLAAEEAARREAERLAAEEAARQEAERLAAEEAARCEAERLAVEEAARQEAARLATEEAARQEAERLAAEEAARCEAERLAVEEAARLATEEGARQEAERLAVEEAARQEAERLAAEEGARREAERLVVEEAARREADEKRRLTLAAASKAVPVKPKTPEQTLVLVADDSKVVRIKTGRLLAAHNYQVQMAEDGLDAARQIENALPDLLMTDVDMPGMNGLQLTRQLRGNPRTARIPIIMITSDSEELLGKAVAAGVNVVLGKPYSEEQLISHIEQLMIVASQTVS